MSQRNIKPTYYLCAMKNPADPSRILFVCLGNICRSPAAENIFRELAQKHGLPTVIDSAGTSAWHQGELPDHRMRSSLKNRGYKVTGNSRPFDPKTDFDQFDFIIAMDDFNYLDLMHLARTDDDKEKISRMKDYFIHQSAEGIPDPYYGGPSGFDQVITLLEDASEGLIHHLKNLA